MRKNQKGFTLVELIIAIAILSVVTLAVCGFIVVGSRSYTSANTDIMLQQDAQLALNQMSDVIIDTTESISYSGLVGGSMQTVLKDSEFSGEVTDKCLAVVNKKPETDDLNQNPSYWFYYSKDDETIYFNEVDLYDGIANPDAGPTASEIKDKFDAASTDKAVLAEHVTEFSVDISQFEQNRVVMLALTFENGNRMYTTSNNVTVRNRIAINDITVGPMKRADEFVINAPAVITLEPGESYSLANRADFNVNGAPAAAGSVTWSLLGEEKNGSSISPDGVVTVGPGETRKNFTVVATRAEFADSRSTVEVTVQVKRVTDVSLTCAQSSVKSGDTVTINATAVGNYLGIQCDGCPDSPAIDHDVTDWTTTNATKKEPVGTRKLDITIDSGLTENDEIVIEATSLLSKNKVYDDVKGILVLKVEKGDEGEYPIQGDLKFGTDNDPGILDYMRANLKTDWWRYVVCVRVREMDATNALDDRVVLYYSTAANIRFFPDIYGLELNRSYKVFFQIIDPVSVQTRQNKANGVGEYYEDSPQEIIDEYFAHIDSSTGKYTGTKYEWDGLYSGLLNQPTITVTYNGITYPNSLSNYYESVNLETVGAGSGIVNKFELGDAINVDRNTILNDIEYVIEKDGTRIYGYDEESHSYTGERNYAGGLIYMEDRGSSMIMKRNNNNTPPAEAYGTYTIIPGFRYANSLDIRDYEYIYPLKNGALDTSQFYREGKGGGDYSEHYYPQDWCKITVRVHNDKNLTLTLQKNDKAKIYLAVPSDSTFTAETWAGGYGFKLGSTEKQVSNTMWLAAYKESGEGMGNISIKLTYWYDSMDDLHKISVTTEQGKDLGTYSCKYGERSWTCIKAGAADKFTDW